MKKIKDSGAAGKNRFVGDMKYRQLSLKEKNSSEGGMKNNLSAGEIENNMSAGEMENNISAGDVRNIQSVASLKINIQCKLYGIRPAGDIKES